MDRLGPIKWLQDLASACLTDKLCGHKCMSLLRSRHSLWHLPVLFSANPPLPVLVEVRFLSLSAPFSLTAESVWIENLGGFLLWPRASGKARGKEMSRMQETTCKFPSWFKNPKYQKKSFQSRAFIPWVKKVCTSSDVARHICQEWNSMTLYWPLLHTHAYYVTLLKTLAVQRHFSKKVPLLSRPHGWWHSIFVKCSLFRRRWWFNFRHLLLHRTSHRHGGPRCTRTGKRPEQWALHFALGIWDRYGQTWAHQMVARSCKRLSYR